MWEIVQLWQLKAALTLIPRNPGQISQEKDIRLEQKQKAIWHPEEEKLPKPPRICPVTAWIEEPYLRRKYPKPKNIPKNCEVSHWTITNEQASINSLIYPDNNLNNGWAKNSLEVEKITPVERRNGILTFIDAKWQVLGNFLINWKYQQFLQQDEHLLCIWYAEEDIEGKADKEQ